MPTRAQIAKKFRSEEARDGVTMSGISEWKRYFFATRQLSRRCFFFCVWLRQIFNYHPKFSMGSQTSICNMNVILPQCANSCERCPDINRGVYFKKSLFLLLAHTCQPFVVENPFTNLTHYTVYLAFYWKSVFRRMFFKVYFLIIKQLLYIE